MAKKTEWPPSEGLKFECQGSGKCCISRGEWGFVYLTIEDRRRLARHLGLATSAFTRRHCEQSGGIWHLKENRDVPECRFLKNFRCAVYEGRPTQCRTWPFWPDVMNAKSWKSAVANFCPGAGRGRRYSADEIKATVQEQSRSDSQLGT